MHVQQNSLSLASSPSHSLASLAWLCLNDPPTHNKHIRIARRIIELVDSISRDEPDSPLKQYITNAGISRARYTIMLFKHHHHVLRLISNRISV